MDLSLVPYVDSPATGKPSSTAVSVIFSGDSNYRECLRNHAASMGGQAYDGCGEFMSAQTETLKCAACGCHRNFHRREGSLLPAPSPMSFFSPHILRSGSPETGRGASETPPRREEGPMRKRYRTKFTQEQKEKMWIFAEKLGWRIQKHDEEKLEEFCVQVGVKRHALKVWMHNHKNNLSSSSTTVAGNGTPTATATATATTIRV